jgi:hypothetical protein
MIKTKYDHNLDLHKSNLNVLSKNMFWIVE